MRSLEEDFNLLKKSWPSTLVARSEVGRFTGGVISPRYCANLDSLGLGCKERIRIGRKVCYPVSAFVAWLEKKSTKLGSPE